MPSISQIVNVQISRETAAIAQAGFGVALIVGESAQSVFDVGEVVKTYTSLDEMVLDGFAVSDPEYLAAQRLMGQKNKPAKFLVGLVTLAADPEATSTWAAELGAIFQADSSWYALIPAEYGAQDLDAAAAYVATVDRIMAVTVHGADTLTNATSGIAHTLKTANHDRVAMFYHATATEQLAAASLGERLPMVPRTGTFKFKSLSGSPVSTLNPTEITNARAKNVNLYLSYGGTPIITEGVMASGEFIDVIIGTDWLKARIAENVFSRLANLPKVEYSDVGFSVVESAIREVLAAGVRNGIILDDETLTVNVPLKATIPVNDRAARILPDVTFTATLSGAVHFVQIRGTVSI